MEPETHKDKPKLIPESLKEYFKAGESKHFFQSFDEAIQNTSVRQRLLEEVLTPGIGDIGTSKILSWEDYYQEGKEKFELLYSLSPPTEAYMKELGVSFNGCDRPTQFSILFNAWCYYEMQGNMAINMNLLHEAKHFFEECFARAQQLDIRVLKARSKAGLVAIAVKSGDRQTQRECIKDARQYYEGTGDLYALKLDQKLAMLEMDEGNMIKSEKLLLNILKEVSAPQNVHQANLFIECLIDLATVKRFRNEWEAALTILDQCEREAEWVHELSRKMYMTSVHFMRAKIYATKFAPVYDMIKAKHSLEWLKANGTIDWLIDELESDVAYKLGHWKKAAEAATKAIAQIKKEGWKQGIAAKQLHLANAYIEMSEPAKAEKELMNALNHLKTFGPPDIYAHALRTWALLEFKKGNLQLAWEKAQQALDEVENLIRFHNSLIAQQLFLLDKQEYYHTAFNIAMHMEGEEGVLLAWQTAERSKSFYICQLVANSDVPLFEGVKEEDWLKLKELDALLDEIEIKISLNKSDTELLEALSAQQATCFSQKQELLEKVMQENPRWAVVRKPGSIDMKTEYRKFNRSWTFLSLYWRNKEGKKLHLFYFDKNGTPKCHTENWSEEEYSLFLKKRNALLMPGLKPATDKLMPDRMAAKILPAEVLKNLAENAALLISPHEELRGLPLHMFAVKDGRKLIDMFAVQYIPTLSLLGLMKHEEISQNRALFLGCSKNGFGDDELKAVPEELQSLATIWKEKGLETKIALVNEDETPETAGFPYSQWNDNYLLHIACHGTFSSDEPMSAALRLGKDAIRGSELFGVKLNTEVVALSACELGRQKEKSSTTTLHDFDTGGDEWIGMYLPMFYAGVRHLLVSLWTANSQETPAFMKAFNASLANNDLPAVAFRKACQEMQHRPGSFWGNWYLVGFPS